MREWRSCTATIEEEFLALLLLQYSKHNAQDNKDWVVKCDYVCVSGGGQFNCHYHIIHCQLSK